MLGAALALIEAAEDEGDEFPFLRAGLAYGPTLPQAGDYYGRAVNLASRITGVARPGSVLVDEATKDAVGGAFTYSFIGERRLKGIDAGGEAFRARRERAGREPRPACGRRRAGCRRARRGGGARARGCRPSAGRCSCGRRSCASGRGPSRARRSTRPCAGPSPRRWRAAPRRRRGAPRSRRRAAGGAGRRGRRRGRRPRPRARGRADCSASATARRWAPISAAPGRGDEHPGPLRQRRQAVAVARGLAGEGDRAARAQHAAEFGEGAVEVGDVVEDGVAEDEVEALVLEGQLLGLGGDGVTPSRPSASAVPARRSSIPGEMSVAVSRSITPSWTRLSEK